MAAEHEVDDQEVDEAAAEFLAELGEMIRTLKAQRDEARAERDALKARLDAIESGQPAP